MICKVLTKMFQITIFKYFLAFVFLVQFCRGTFLENILENFRLEGSQSTDAIKFKNDFNIDEPLLKLFISLDIQIKGLTDFEIHQALLTPDLKLKLDVTLYDAVVSGNYFTNGTYYKIMPLRGQGDILLQLKQFRLYLDTMILPENGYLQLLHFDVDYNFNDIMVSIAGLTGESDVGAVLQHFIEDLVPNAMSRHRKEIISFIKQFSMTKGNEILKTFTLRRIIELIKILFVY